MTDNDSDQALDDLEISFDEKELEIAQIPLLPSNHSSDSTHTLVEAPLPTGVTVNSSNIFEPVLNPDLDDFDDTNRKILPPSFFSRLGLSQNSNEIKIKNESQLAWSLTRGNSWPVFVKRQRLRQPFSSETLMKTAIAAKRWGDNRICLGPLGELDIFFNDRESFEKANQELDDPQNSPSGVLPFNFIACRGLLICHLAAMDSLTTAAILEKLFNEHKWQKAPRRNPVLISVAACEAETGFNCGVCEYPDLKITGGRTSYPVINNQLLAISTRINLLVAKCPGQALKNSHLKDQTLEIIRENCRHCGWCVSQDPAFSWPEPQGGYFSLKLSGRRQQPQEFIPPRLWWPKLPKDLNLVAARLIEVLERWRMEARENEILADFVARQDLSDLFLK